MNAVTELLGQPAVGRLGMVLVHFLWQGAAVAALAMVALAAMGRRSAQVRYVVAMVLFGAMALCPVSTWVIGQGVDDAQRAGSTGPGFVGVGASGGRDSTSLRETRDRRSGEPDTAGAWKTRPAHVPALVRPAGASAPRTLSLAGVRSWLNRQLPWIVAAWLVGVVLLSLRLLIGFAGLRSMRRRGVQEIDGVSASILQRLTARLGIRRPVRVLQAALAEVPTVLGWLKPVVLLPASALTGLSPAQLEAILAHELAHVRRHDYLVNVLQSVVETLLFYHPAVWWLSGRIRREREHCCDDLAVAVCGDRLLYARALATLEASRTPHPALAATGGPLLSRIRRLVGVAPAPCHGRTRWLAGVVAVAAVVAMAAGLHLSASWADAQAERLHAADRPAIPAENSVGTGDATAAPEGLVAVLGESRLRHWASIRSMAYSPDGRLLATGSGDHTVRIWDARDGRELHRFAQRGSATRLAFSGDGKTLATVSSYDTEQIVKGPVTFRLADGRKEERTNFVRRDAHGELELWDVDSGALIRTVASTAFIRDMDFSRDGKTLATAGKGKVQLWDAASGRLVRSVEEHYLGAYLYTVAFSPDGSTLAFGTFPGGTQLGPPVGVPPIGRRPNQGKIKLWNLKTGKVRAVLDGHESWPHRLRYSPNGKLLASSGSDAVKIWDAVTGELKMTLIGRAAVHMAFSADSRLLAINERNSVNVIDVATGEVVRSFNELTGDVSVVEFAPDSSVVVTTTFGLPGPMARDLTTGETRPLPQGSSPALRVPQFSGDGKTLVTAADDAVLRLWDVATGKVRQTFSGHTGLVLSIALSTDGKLLASSASDKRVILWEVETGKQVDAISVSAKWPRVALSADGHTMAYSGEQGGVDLYDVTKRKRTQTLARDSSYLWALAFSFSPDGRILAESSYLEEPVVRLWDVETGEVVRRFTVPERPRLYDPDSPQSLSFSPDGKTLAVGIHHTSETEDAPVLLFDVATGKVLHTLGPHRGWVTFGTFSPDGTTVATSSEDGQVRFWDADTGKLREIRRIGPTAGEVHQVAFSPDGRLFATANGNGTVYLLNVP